MMYKFKLNQCCCWRRNSKSEELSEEEIMEINQDIFKIEDEFANIDLNDEEGNPRNKVALQPGHSLMDWIRLGTSGKDLTGLGSKSGSLAVTRQELSKHNKRFDAWTAVRGKVYNLTEYFEFHPGGEEELMRAAGIDATNIFDEIHPWVNYEQILQKCLIGKLVAVDPNLDIESLFFSEKNSLSPTNNSRKIERASENSTTNNDNKAKIELNESLPRFDWIQKLDYVTVIFYTKSFSNPLVEVSHAENEQNNIEICLKYEGISYKNKIVFQKPIHWAYEINLIIESGKVEIKFKKLISGIWDSFGILQQNIESEECFKFKYILKEKTQVNYNTWLLKFLRSDRKRIIVPVGYHIRIYGLFDGKEISRSYTPVPGNVLYNSVPHSYLAEAYLYFLIKRYPDGKISPFITDSKIENELEFTKPIGTFNLKLIEKRETFLLLAAGTGITPMLSLIIFLLERRIRRCQFIRVLFFNRTESDIILRDQLESLALKDKRLKIDNILSQPQDDWKGLKGLVNSNLIENSLNHHLKDTGYTIKDIFCFICGPPNFNKLAKTQLEEIKFSQDQIHCFE